MLFSQTEQPTSLEKLREIEKSVELTLPGDYVEHILKYNGGKCKPSVFSFVENGTLTESNVDWFLAVYDGEYDNLETYLMWYKIQEKRMPLHMFPIAHDPGGNLICISCGANDYGQVYFWDHEQEVNYDLYADNNYSNLYRIAPSFGEFLSGLSNDPLLE